MIEKFEKFLRLELGPCIFTSTNPKGVATLSKQGGCALKTKYKKSQVQAYIIRFDEKLPNEVET